MCKMIEQHADKIKGQFFFFGRMIINGYFHLLLSEKTRIGSHSAMGIHLRDYTGYFKNAIDCLIRQTESGAEKLSRSVICLLSPEDKKEGIARNLLPFSPVDDGLICVLKILEACRTAKVVGAEEKQSPTIKNVLLAAGARTCTVMRRYQNPVTSGSLIPWQICIIKTIRSIWQKQHNYKGKLLFRQLWTGFISVQIFNKSLFLMRFL